MGMNAIHATESTRGGWWTRLIDWLRALFTGRSSEHEETEAEGPAAPEGCKECSTCEESSSAKGLESFNTECNFSLPSRGVVEDSRYEQFVLLNAKLGDTSAPIVLNLASTQDRTRIARSGSTIGRDDFRQIVLNCGGVPLDMVVEEERADTLLEAPDATPMESLRPMVEAGYVDLRAARLVGARDPSSFRLALYLPFRQQWTLRGYSKGRMLNAVSLGPLEEQTVEVFTWDRTSTTLDSSSSVDTTQSKESSSTQRDSRDVTRAVGSQSDFSLTTNGKVAFQVGVVNADISGGTSARLAFNATEQSTINAISEATERASSEVSTSRKLTVTETHEYGRETRVTRQLKNPNACTTVTTAFFEVLTHYTVSTQLMSENVQLVALIPATSLGVPLTFDRDSVRLYEGVLAPALLSLDLMPGFAAARLLYSVARTRVLLCEGCACASGDAENDAGANQWPAVAESLRRLGECARSLDARTTFPVSVDGGVFLPLPGGAIANDPDACADIRRHLAQKYARAAMGAVIDDLVSMPAEANLVNPSEADIAQGLLEGLSPEATAGLQYDKATKDAVVAQCFGYLASPLSPFPAKDPVSIGVAMLAVEVNVDFNHFDDKGLLAAIRRFSSDHKAWKDAIRASRSDTDRDREIRRINDEETSRRFFEIYPAQEIAAAEERLEVLLLHLNHARFVDHYRFAVWSARGTVFDPSLLAWAHMGLIEPRPIGFVGEELAVPVRMEGKPFAEAFLRDILSDLPRSQRVRKQRLLLPSPAVYSDSYVSRCSACDPSTEASRQLELENGRLDLELKAAELARRKARISARPQQLDNDITNPSSIRVILEKGDT